MEKTTDSLLSLDDVLALVSDHSPLFKAYEAQLTSFEFKIAQATAWANPELEFAFEEFAWDRPGFNETEISIILSQELELFGQRASRKKYAESQYNAYRFTADQALFDLYLETKGRFYSLAHAQKTVSLSEQSLKVTHEISANIEFRLNKGASLESELLLAQLEEQQASMRLYQAKQEYQALAADLQSLWGGERFILHTVTNPEPDLTHLFEILPRITTNLDSTRTIKQFTFESALLQSEKQSMQAETKPSLTLLGGFKRSEIDNSHSFLFGLSLPLPFLNRNSNAQNSINSQIESLQYHQEQKRNQIIGSINVSSIRLKELQHRHDVLDTLLLVTARTVYNTLKKNYESGRVAYTQLLEAERSLNHLSLEHNDLMLEINSEIINLENITGFVIKTSREQ